MALIQIKEESIIQNCHATIRKSEHPVYKSLKRTKKEDKVLQTEYLFSETLNKNKNMKE